MQYLPLFSFSATSCWFRALSLFFSSTTTASAGITKGSMLRFSIPVPAMRVAARLETAASRILPAEPSHGTQVGVAATGAITSTAAVPPLCDQKRCYRHTVKRRRASSKDGHQPRPQRRDNKRAQQQPPPLQQQPPRLSMFGPSQGRWNPQPERADTKNWTEATHRYGDPSRYHPELLHPDRGTMDHAARSSSDMAGRVSLVPDPNRV
jgi:hypothetical protein